MYNKYGWQFYHWHIEPSSKCSLRCPRCPRTELPNTPWLQKELSLEQFQNAFTPDFISEYVQRFTMCGDVGDSIYCKDYLKIVDYIKQIKPTCHVYTITNGSYKTKSWWEEFARISNEYDTINFSVDGYDQASNDLYRVNNNFKSIMDGMWIMGHESSAFVNWACIYFSFNQDHTNTIVNLARQNGCDSIQWTKSTKFNSKYDGAYGILDPLEPRPEFVSKTDRYERHIQKLKNRIQNIDQYMTTNLQKYLHTKPVNGIIPLCKVGNRGMYLNAEGTIHPCSWTSFPYTTMSYGDKVSVYKESFFEKYRHILNINNGSTLEEVLNHDLWQKFFNGMETDTWVECSLKCRSSVVDKDYAVGYETN
jgi:MoaA/NifB/PqqE/SkfB family radical SAM enzyme